MKGRTYRFFEGTPLYAFGHGLSYTTFRYARLRTDAASLRPDGETTVRVDVTNTGERAGDEVVQLYVRHPSSKVPRPRQELRGYRRVHLRPGETRTVTFALPARALAYWDTDADRWTVEQAPVELRVGASSADIRVERTLPVTAAP
jgi:beta-glucosidase